MKFSVTAPTLPFRKSAKAPDQYPSIPREPLRRHDGLSCADSSAIGSRPVAEPKPCDENRDSGYVTIGTLAPETRRGSITTMVDSAAGLSLRAKLSKRPITLKRYQKPLTDSYKRRFLDLKPLFEEALSDYMRRKHLQCRASSMNLMFLGENEDSAKPYFLITCDKSTVAPIRFFFNQNWVKEELKPDRTSGFPHFELHVSPNPPQPASGSSIYVYGNHSRELAHWDSLSGVSIAVQGEEEMRVARIGGLIQCISSDGDIFVRGLTVGHLITPWETTPAPGLSEEELRRTNNCMPDMNVDDFSDFEEDEGLVELDSSSSLQDNFESVKKLQHQYDWGVAHMYIGFVCEAPTIDKSGRNLDYALVMLDGRTRYRPSPRPNDDSHRLWTSGSPVEGLDRPVYLLNQCNQNGWFRQSTGRLGSTKSSLLLAPGYKYVDTYKLTMDIGYRISSGDCGSWVIDQKTDEVYGQLVATDAFQEAHVMPLGNILQDIKSRLGLAAIALTLESDALQIGLYEEYGIKDIDDLDITIPSFLDNETQCEPSLRKQRSASVASSATLRAQSISISNKREYFGDVLRKWRMRRARLPIVPEYSPIGEKTRLFEADESASMSRPSFTSLRQPLDPVDRMYPTT